IGILTAPGMWPAANSEPERTSTSRAEVDGRVCSSATVRVGLKISSYIREERELGKKDSRDDWEKQIPPVSLRSRVGMTRVRQIPRLAVACAPSALGMTRDTEIGQER